MNIENESDTFQELSTKVFDVKKKLGDQEYRDIYELLSKFKKEEDKKLPKGIYRVWFMCTKLYDCNGDGEIQSEHKTRKVLLELDIKTADNYKRKISENGYTTTSYHDDNNEVDGIPKKTRRLKTEIYAAENDGDDGEYMKGYVDYQIDNVIFKIEDVM
tara:strand:- start:45 stop:521 length:477 start_codon:yes stop_codon:yes gene_type:complete